MNEKPILSIVTPTRGNFSDYWFNQLLQVQGNVELLLVYPPGVPMRAIADPRIKSLTSPYKGEMMQRFVGLLNASGDYVLALDDDDFVHPQVVDLIVDYFNHYPDSWILRLKKAVIDFRDIDEIKKDWLESPQINTLEVCQKYDNGNYTGLLEVPIAPLDKNFDWRWLFFPWMERKDNNGYHFENFNNIVWKNEVVQQALPDLTLATHLSGPLTWIPNSGFDRLLGLFVQAKQFESGKVIGHWLPGAEQIRYIDKPASMKPPRFHVFSDALLVKYFPQYGYFWNLFFSKLYGVPRTIGKMMKLKLLSKAN